MGYTLTANNSSYSFDGGYGQFINLRKNIALLWDEEFGLHYSHIDHLKNNDEIDCFNDETDRLIEKMGDKSEKDSDILDFLFASDTGGEISHKTCKKIYELIKDVDFGLSKLRYTGIAHNDYEEFKLFLMECYSNRRKARWY